METKKRNLTESLPDILNKMKNNKIVVIGDLILDKFLYGTVDKISPEAPVPIVNIQDEKITLGGAANVVRNISTLGGVVYPVGVIGKDQEGSDVTWLLKECNANTYGVVMDTDRPTTVKTRIIAQHQQVVRLDRECSKYLDPDIEKIILKRALKLIDDASVVVISDYAKGVISNDLMEKLIYKCKKLGKPIIVDPKPDHAIFYFGSTGITPNVKEAERLTGGYEIITDFDAEKAGYRLIQDLDLKFVLLTRSEKGMSLIRKYEDPIHISTEAKDVFDVTGAGDTAISLFALAMSAGVDIVDSVLLANLASGIVVGKIGTSVVTPEELLNAVEKWKNN